MQKVLRSFIHEHFTHDLLVELELLSKRRDITNKDKQTELFKSLSKHSVDAVGLGSGTNRYGFKMGPFAVKFATNTDGKIDNLKEFKMGPRLYPDVAQTFEVSGNGTILVAEYIQPFENFMEMRQYEKQIRNILEKMSAVFMIGDVGLVEKNYANWGLRLGTTYPVCLDFAYVYNVSSELFICHNCKYNAMLEPTQDYASLKCPACKHVYQFEDIRRRIGNDLHAHEIGDMRDEGYTLYGSSVQVELDDVRSPYLKKKVVTAEPKQKDDEPTFDDTFCMKVDQNTHYHNI